MRTLVVVGFVFLVGTFAGCGRGEQAPESERPGEEERAAMKLASLAFKNGQAIPVRFTCDGEDLSPPLEWQGVPEGAKSLALVVDDPDAPTRTFTHWLVANIDPALTTLPEGSAVAAEAGLVPVEGENGFRGIGYGGPCPPPGETHRYFFKLSALDQPLELPAGFSKAQLLRAMEGHVVGKAEFMGTYRRQ